MANDAGCPIIVADGAAGMVWTAYDKYSQFATKAYDLAWNQTQTMGYFSLTPVAINTHWNYDPLITGFSRPVAPTLPPIDYRDPGNVPAVPDTQINPIQLTAAPADPNVPVPQFVDFAPPGAPTYGAPPTMPALAPVAIPELPAITMPDLPTLLDLNLPDAPTIVIPPFSGQRPVNNLAAPANTWTFTPEQYVSALLDKTRNTISTMLDGGTGLPVAVVQALRDRANAGVDVEQARGEQEVVEDFASRGFEQPSGALVKRLAAVRQDAANRRNSLNRDIFIQEQQVAVENLRFAVTQGVALESTLIQAHSEEMRLALSAAQYARDTSIALFNAQVSLFNTEMQAFQIDAQVWRSQIEGELAQLEVYRAQIQAQQLRGEINTQLVQMYSERVRAVSIQADLYRAEMEGAQAQARANESVAQAYRAQVEGFAQNVRAYEVQWEAFRSQMASNETRARIYELTEGAYATRVRAWSETNQAKIAQQGAEIQTADMKLRGWRGQLDAVLAKYTAERDRVGALVSISGQQVDLFRAQVGVESAASDANLRALTLGIEQERARTATELQNAEMQIRQMQQNAALLLQAKESVARVSAQLAASSMSAVNFSAGTHSSLGQSFGCSTSYSYTGTLDTPTV